jgi:nicotinamide mononucleotide transporter
MVGNNNIPQWIATALNLIGLIINAKKSPWCWPLWIVGSMIFMFIFATQKDWATFSLFAGYQIINIYGLYEWIKNKNDTSRTIT